VLVRLAPNSACVSDLSAVSPCAEAKEPCATTLLSFFCTSALAVEKAQTARTRGCLRFSETEVPEKRGCQVPPKPAHSVSTLSASRASLPKSDESFSERSAHLFYLPGLFRPGNTPVLPPSGFCSSRRSRPVSEPLPPMPFRTILSPYIRLRRFDPSEKGRRRAEARLRLTLLAFTSLRLSFSLP
jgi:hypothetical protein